MALGRFSFDFTCFFAFFLDVHWFCCDLVILGSYFDILGILGIWEKMCSVGFSLVFEFLFCWGILLSRVSFLFLGDTKPTKTTTITWSLVDRGGGIWDFQHCIVITRGQEERIPKTASVVGTNFGLGSFFLWLCVFFTDFFSFAQFLWIWGGDLGFPALHRHHSGTGRKDTQNGKRCGN